MLIRVDRLSDAAFQNQIRRSAAAYGYVIDSPLSLSLVPTAGTERLLSLDVPISASYRYAPHDFETCTGLIPAPRRDTLPGLERALMSSRPELALTFVPPILQLDVPIYTTIDCCSMPGISIPTTNAPVAAEAIAQLGITFVIVAESSRLTLADALRAIGVSVAHWYIIAPPRAVPQPHPDHLIDIHAYPGASIATQCSYIRGTRTFHPSDAYVWESVDGEMIATSVLDVPVPLLRMPVARGRIDHASCACGAPFILIYGD